MPLYKWQTNPELPKVIIITFYMSFYIYKVYIKAIIQILPAWLFVQFDYLFVSKTFDASNEIIMYFLFDPFQPIFQKRKKGLYFNIH